MATAKFALTFHPPCAILSSPPVALAVGRGATERGSVVTQSARSYDVSVVLHWRQVRQINADRM